MFVQSSYYFLPFLSLFFGSNSLSSGHTQACPPGRRSIYTYYLESSVKNICVFSTFIYVFIHSFICVWTHIYLFYTLSFNPILSHLFCCSCIPLKWPLPFIFLVLRYFLVVQDTSDSSSIFPSLALELGISPKNPSSFYWKIVF